MFYYFYAILYYKPESSNCFETLNKATKAILINSLIKYPDKELIVFDASTRAIMQLVH